MSRVEIGSFLTRVKNVVIVEDDQIYKRVTIRTKGKGVCIRDEICGSEIGTKRQFKVNEGHFLVSKIDARNGAFGIAGKEIQDAIVTNDFLTFKVNKDLVDIEWFNLFVSTPLFIKICQEASSGTTNRMRLKEEKFLKFTIELPSLKNQIKILEIHKKYQKRIGFILEQLETQLKDVSLFRQRIIDEAIRGQLYNEKSSEPISILVDKIEEWKNLNNGGRKRNSNKILPPPCKSDEPFEIPSDWQWLRMGQIIELSENLNIQTKLPPDQIINYLDIDSIDHKHQVIKEHKQELVKNLSTRARRVLKKDMIVYSLVRPYLNNMAIIDVEKENYIGTTGFVAFETILVNNKYVFYFLLSSYVRDKFMEFLTGFNSPSITLQQFLDLEIPIPPKNVQEKLVLKLDKIMNFCRDIERKVTEIKEEIIKLHEKLLLKHFPESTLN